MNSICFFAMAGRPLRLSKHHHDVMLASVAIVLAGGEGKQFRKMIGNESE